MKHAEMVTFGGSSLDRAANIRSTNTKIAEAMQSPTSRALLYWRGKPLIQKARPASVAQLPLKHPIFTGLSDPFFLGRNSGHARFVYDLHNWEPEEGAAIAANGFLDHTEQQHPALKHGLVFMELRKVMTWLSPQDAELAATAKALLNWHKTHPFCAACGSPSDVKEAGWQRICPSCGATHFPRTDPVVIMLITRGNSVLIGRSPGWPEGMYSLLAGFVEPGETLEAAVRREVFEETGVRVGSVKYLSSQPWPFPSSLMIGCFGEAISNEINIDPHEIEDAIWVSREEMMRIFSGEHGKLLPARKGAIAHFLLENWLADRLD